MFVEQAGRVLADSNESVHLPAYLEVGLDPHGSVAVQETVSTPWFDCEQ